MIKIIETKFQQHQANENQNAQQPQEREPSAPPHTNGSDPEQTPCTDTRTTQWTNLPTDMKGRNQWVLAGPDKRPVTTSGRAASSTDPSTWTSFDEACSAAISKNCFIGYVLHSSDPFTCIDLDVKDTTSDEEINTHERIISNFDSYTERSCGGRGYHVWIKGKIGKGARRGSVEVYSQERFIICTGDTHINRLIEERQSLLESLILEMRPHHDDSVEIDFDAAPNMDLAARAAEDPTEMGRLFRGDWEGRHYPSQSEADLALISFLLPACNSAGETWATFRLSKLGERDKSKRRSYAEHTLIEAKRRAADSLTHIRNGKKISHFLLSKQKRSDSGSQEPSVELLDAATLTPEPIRWLWPGWLARGKLHVLAGAPGTGKTTLAMNFAATVSSGGELPDGTTAEKGRVIIWSGEDDPTDTLLPRLIAADADLTYVQFIGDVRDKQGNRAFDPATDVAKLRVAASPDVAMIIVDPLVSAVAGDSHKNAEVRRSLAPLVDLAIKLDAALIGITHYSKGTQGRDPLERVSGSLAFGAVARIVFGTARQGSNDADTQRMVLARAKSNIGQDGGGFNYGFEQVQLRNEIIASRIHWGEALHGTARDLLEEPDAIDDLETGPQSAVDFLRDLLSGGPMTADDAKRKGEAAGFSSRALQRALKRAGFKSKRQGFSGIAHWSLD